MANANSAVELLDLRRDQGIGVLLSRESRDLDLNLLRFVDGQGVGTHRNTEVDVVVVVLAGAGRLDAGGEELDLLPGWAALIPKGVERSIHSLPDQELVYLSLHRRRPGLMPRVPRRA